MSYARAERRAARARARVAGWIRVGLRSGAGRTALSTLRLFVGRREACIENAPCAWPCATQFAVYFRIPKERPARCVACTRAEHSRAVRTRVHNDRITIRRVTLTRAVAGIAVYVCTADRQPGPGACSVYVSLRFYPRRPRPIPRPCARVAAGAHTPTRHAPLRCGPQTPRV